MKRIPSAVVIFLCCFSLSPAQSSSQPAVFGKLDSRLRAIVEHSSSFGVLGKFLPPGAAADKAGGKYNIIVYSSNVQEAILTGVQPRTVTSNFFTADATADQIGKLSVLGSVEYIALARRYKPALDKSVPEIHADKLQDGSYNGTSYTGKNVIVGFVDTGIDWTHLDFRADSDATQSRILWMWDQTGSGGAPAGFTKGTEYSQAQISAELGASPPHVVKEKDTDGHGTHVAGIAAGDGSSNGGKYKGVAPNADIIFVKTTFNDADIIDGITYIRQKAEAAGKPFVINLSLGSQSGAHDGTDAMETDIDQELAKPGRAVVVAAGNEGTDQIHADTTLTQGGTATYQFSIPAYTASGATDNDYVEFDLWYQSQDQLTVTVTSPNGAVVSAISGNLTTVQTSTNDGAVEIDNASNGVSPLNQLNECVIFIYDSSPTKPPRAGTWQIKVSAVSIGQGGGEYDLWLSDSQLSTSNGATPLLTTGYSFRKLVGSPGTSKKAITVGSYITKFKWPSIDGHTYSFVGEDTLIGQYSAFSSMGPTRDGRQKPEICGPGEVIVSALSKDSSPDTALIDPDGEHVVLQGTSMATPHVAGVAALLLQAKPGYTSDQIKNAMTSTARKDVFTGGSVSSQWGYGKIDATGSMGSVLAVKEVTASVPRNFSLEQNYPNPFNPSTQIHYTLPQNFRGMVSLTVFDILGKKVAALVNEEQTAGTYTATWNAATSASGVYFCMLRAGTFFDVKKMVLMK